jgi:hypothetical protein
MSPKPLEEVPARAREGRAQPPAPPPSTTATTRPVEMDPINMRKSPQIARLSGKSARRRAKSPARSYRLTRWPPPRRAAWRGLYTLNAVDL